MVSEKEGRQCSLQNFKCAGSQNRLDLGRFISFLFWSIQRIERLLSPKPVITKKSYRKSGDFCNTKLHSHSSLTTDTTARHLYIRGTNLDLFGGD